MIELIGVRIWAIPLGESGPVRPRKLPCGVLVSLPPEDKKGGAAPTFPARFELPDNQGVFVPFSGVFRLSTGELAAVYGAVEEPIG